MKENFDKLYTELINVISPSTPVGSLGIIYAVTNRDQKGGAAFLARIGFKQVITTDKYGSMSTQKRVPTSPCITWAGNWFDDVQPCLVKEEEEIRKRKIEEVPKSGLRSKFGSLPQSTTFRRMRIWEGHDVYRRNYTFTPTGVVNIHGANYYETNEVLNTVGNPIQRPFGGFIIRAANCMVTEE